MSYSCFTSLKNSFLNTDVLYLWVLKIIIISPCIIWFDGHYNCMRFTVFETQQYLGNKYALFECLFGCHNLCQVLEKELWTSSWPQRTDQSKVRRSKKNHLCLLRASISPICYGSVVETRFLDMRDSQIPLYSRPKENCGLFQLCLLPIL